LAKLLAARGTDGLSLVLFRHSIHHQPSDQVAVPTANLPRRDVDAGIVVIDPSASGSDRCS
jgi:hypothetical protein